MRKWHIDTDIRATDGQMFYSYGRELKPSFLPSYGLAKHSQVSLTISWLQRICNPTSLHSYHSSDLLSHKAFLPCSLQPARFPPSQLHGLFLTCNNQDRINLTRMCENHLTLVPCIKAKLSQLNNLKSHNSFVIPSQTYLIHYAGWRSQPASKIR